MLLLLLLLLFRINTDVYITPFTEIGTIRARQIGSSLIWKRKKIYKLLKIQSILSHLIQISQGSLDLQMSSTCRYKKNLNPQKQLMSQSMFEKYRYFRFALTNGDDSHTRYNFLIKKRKNWILACNFVHKNKHRIKNETLNLTFDSNLWKFL